MTPQFRPLALLYFITLFAIIPMSAQAADTHISGEMQSWRPVTIDFAGPESSETDTTNPFSDYRLDVTFSKGRSSYTVPGYYAACGTAADTSCESGNIWRVHFTPGEPGTWAYKINFVTGQDVALGGKGRKVKGIENAKGRFNIAPAGDPKADPRNRGRLNYVNSHYLEYAATGDIFFKAGPDAPENTLAYDGFDATPDVNGLRKDWAAHLGDAEGIDLDKYGWKDGEGAELLGMFNYIAEQGLNSVSFLTFNIGGDDRNVFPHLLKGSAADYTETATGKEAGFSWSPHVYRDRFDVSKMDQWQRALTYANDRGLFLHFKLQETENDHLMDGGATGRERRLYLREIIARYSHFLALNWNMGEENNQPAQYIIDMASEIERLDPYGHLRVSHSFPFEKFRYFDLLGDKSPITGLSLQGSEDGLQELRSDLIEWTLRSELAGKPWVLSYDEPGNGLGGTPVDTDYPDELLPQKRTFTSPREFIRGKMIWEIFTGGGTGVEFYYGYETGCGDLTCQDHRTRANTWNDARNALDFMRKYVGRDVLDMTVLDTTTYPMGAAVFGKRGEKYVLYLPKGGKQTLFTGAADAVFDVSWYDPRKGGDFAKVTTISTEGAGLKGKLEIPPAPYSENQDWVVLIVKP